MTNEISNTVIRSTNSLKENSNTVIRNTSRVKVQNTAEYYVKKLNAPNWRMFFLKVAWRLNEDVMATIYERATKRCPNGGEDRLKYFIKACTSEMSS